MSFILQQADPKPTQVVNNGNQYTILAKQPYQLQQGGNHMFDTGLILNSLPPNCVLQMVPTQQCVNEEVDSTPKRYQSKDCGQRMVGNVHSKKHKKGRQGDGIFKMMVKSISDVGMQLLPFVLKKKIQKKKKYIL